jgi:hypothetical protein
MNLFSAMMMVARGFSAWRTPSSKMAFRFAVDSSAATRSAEKSISSIGTSMTLERWISSALTRSGPTGEPV